MHTMISKVVGLSLITLGACGIPAIAQPTSWTTLNNQAKGAFQQGDFIAAEKNFTLALSEAKKSAPNSVWLALSLNNLGNFYCAQSKYSKAEPLFQEALALLKTLTGQNSIMVASALNSLGNAYLGEGKYKDAEQVYKTALSIAEKSNNSDTIALQALNCLTVVSLKEGRYAEAKVSGQRALNLVESKSSLDVDASSATYNQMSAIYEHEREFQKSESMALKSLALDEKRYGPNHPLLASELNNLGRIKEEEGHLDDALAFYQRALKICERTGINNHGSLLSANNLALLSAKVGKSANSEQMLLDSLASMEKLLGPNHPDVAKVKLNLGVLCVQTGRLDEGCKLLKEALVIADNAKDPPLEDLAVATNDLGYAYFTQKKYQSALELYARSLTLREKVYGPNHPSTAVVLSNLGYAYAATGQLSDAENSLQRAITIFEKSPENRQHLKECYTHYSELLTAEGKIEQAKSIESKISALN
jgi:tetratricopeptide (TPR) repeat protein